MSKKQARAAGPCHPHPPIHPPNCRTRRTEKQKSYQDLRKLRNEITDRTQEMETKTTPALRPAAQRCQERYGKPWHSSSSGLVFFLAAFPGRGVIARNGAPGTTLEDHENKQPIVIWLCSAQNSDLRPRSRPTMPGAVRGNHGTQRANPFHFNGNGFDRPALHAARIAPAMHKTDQSRTTGARPGCRHSTHSVMLQLSNSQQASYPDP